MTELTKYVDGVVMPLDADDLAMLEAMKPGAAPVPQSITRRQALLALLRAGLLDDAEAAVAAADRAVRIEWESASVFERHHPLLMGIAAQLNPPLTEEQIDDLFRTAAAL